MEGGKPKRTKESSGDFGFDEDKYEQNNPDRTRIKRSKQEKINIIVVIGVGVVAIFLGVYEFAHGIMNPYYFLQKNPQQQTQASTTEQILSATDTDSDGLSDYDELYTYGTSPYLPDSDGDGTGDGDEIKAGTDPNCPQGQQCQGFSFSTSSSDGVPSLIPLPNASGGPVVDPATIRQVLIQGGMKADDVNSLTDAEIMQLYQDAVAKNPDLQSQAQQAGISVPSTSTQYAVPKQIDISTLKINSLDDLKNLTGAQIKALMTQNGASADVVNQLSDDEVRQIFLEKLNQQ